MEIHGNSEHTAHGRNRTPGFLVDRYFRCMDAELSQAARTFYRLNYMSVLLVLSIAPYHLQQIGVLLAMC